MAKLIEVMAGQEWTARVSGRAVTVKVLRVDKNRGRRCLTLLNLNTGRTIQRSAAFLRRKVSNG